MNIFLHIFFTKIKLKNLITEKDLIINAKYEKERRISFYGNFIFLSNNEYTLPVRWGDKRIVMVEVSEDRCGDNKYFARFAKACEEGLKDWYHYLMSYEIKEYNSQDIPETSMRRRAYESSIPKSILYLRWIKENIEMFNEYKDEDVYKIPTSELFETYKNNYCIQENIRSDSRIIFTRNWNAETGIESKTLKFHNSYYRGYVLSKELCEEILKKYDV